MPSWVAERRRKRNTSVKRGIEQWVLFRRIRNFMDCYQTTLPHIYACFVQNGFQAAWDLLAERQRQAPHQTAWVHLQGNLLFEVGQYAAALERYESALQMTPNNARLLADAGSALHMRAYFPEALRYYRAALTCQVNAPDYWPPMPSTAAVLNHAEAEQLLWQVLASLAKAGLHAFATSGVLLGLEREGRLLPFDKDLDIGLPFNELEAAKALLLQQGWVLAPAPKGLQTPLMLAHPQKGMSLDLCGFRVEPETGQTISGFWVKDAPKKWQRITVFPTLHLIQKASPCGAVWHLREPEAVLAALYGPDWRIPDPDFDTVVSAYNQRSFSLITQCYAVSRLYWHWINGRYQKALSIARHSLRQQPDDPLLRQTEEYLTAHVLKDSL